MQSIWNRLEFFAKHEFGNHGEKMTPAFLFKLDKARYIAGCQFRITSSWREGSHNHSGTAVDIACGNSMDRFAIVRGLILAGFQRIGVYDKHVHADLAGDRPVKVLWLGVST